MSRLVRVIAAIGLVLSVHAGPVAADQVLFKDVNIFNGKDDKLISGQDVLVDGQLIKAIGRNLSVAAGDKVIDGGGRTLLPGFIESHAHLMLMGPSLPEMEAATTWEDFAIHATRMAEMYLMQGFTTVRDAGAVMAACDGQSTRVTLWVRAFTRQPPS